MYNKFKASLNYVVIIRSHYKNRTPMSLPKVASPRMVSGTHIRVSRLRDSAFYNMGNRLISSNSFKIDSKEIVTKRNVICSWRCKRLDSLDRMSSETCQNLNMSLL